MVGNSHFFHRDGLIEKGRGLLIGCRLVIWVLVRCFGVDLLFGCGLVVWMWVRCFGVDLLLGCGLVVGLLLGTWARKLVSHLEGKRRERVKSSHVCLKKAFNV